LKAALEGDEEAVTAKESRRAAESEEIPKAEIE